MHLDFMIKRTLMLFIFLMTIAFSDAYARHDLAIKLESDGKVLSFEKLVEKALEIHPGRVIEAEILTENNGYVYELEILDEDGVLWELKFNASTGILIGSSKEE